MASDHVGAASDSKGKHGINAEKALPDEDPERKLQVYEPRGDAQWLYEANNRR